MKNVKLNTIYITPPAKRSCKITRWRKLNCYPHNSRVKFVNFLPSYARRSKITTLIIFLTLAALCGCGIGKPLRLSEEKVLGQVKEQYVTPLAYEVGISTSVSEIKGSEGLISSTEISEGVAEALNGSVFKEAQPGTRKGRHRFKLGVTDFELKYAGRSGATVPSIILWTLSTPIVSMFVGDETYSAIGQRIRYPVSRRARSCGVGRQEPVSNSVDATILPAQKPDK